MAKKRISAAEAERLIAMSARVQDAAGRLREGTAREDQPSVLEMRIGLDAVSIGHAALVSLLIERGMFTGADYLESLAECMEQEADDMERGTDVDRMD